MTWATPCRVFPRTWAVTGSVASNAVSASSDCAGHAAVALAACGSTSDVRTVVRGQKCLGLATAVPSGVLPHAMFSRSDRGDGAGVSSHTTGGVRSLRRTRVSSFASQAVATAALGAAWLAVQAIPAMASGRSSTVVQEDGVWYEDPMLVTLLAVAAGLLLCSCTYAACRRAHANGILEGLLARLARRKAARPKVPDVVDVYNVSSGSVTGAWCLVGVGFATPAPR